MKLLKTILCLTLQLELLSGVLTEHLKEKSFGQIHLAHRCLKITLNGEKDDRAPVLVVHGFTEFSGMFLDLVEDLALKTNRKVCAIDLRNHGDSPWSEETDTKVMASDFNLLMRTLDTEKIVIVGHSMGGKVAVEFALTYPEKVEKIIVEDMRPNGLSEEFQKIFGGNLDYLRNALRLIPNGSTEKEAKKIVGNFYKKLFRSFDETLLFDEKYVDYVPIKCSEGKCSWKSNLDVLDKVQEDPLKFCLHSTGKCEKPALFIYGDASLLKVGDVKEEILELFPNAKLHAVKGGHHIINGYPEYRNQVIDFINAVD